MHAPDKHAYWHDAEPLHTPALHVCGTRPTQRFWLLAQVHWPAVHCAVSPEQTVVSCQSPLASHVCVVVETPGLHRVPPVAHTRQAPAVHVPLSVPLVHEVPSDLLPTLHALPAQLAWRHGLVGCVHCAALVHCTHVAAVQYGVGDAHALTGSYCPLELHVSTPLPLHVLSPGVHAWQVPRALHVPPLHAVPGVLGA